jgi:hypothetical protein
MLHSSRGVRRFHYPLCRIRDGCCVGKSFLKQHQRAGVATDFGYDHRGWKGSMQSQRAREACMCVCVCAAHQKFDLIGKGISGRKTRPIQTHDFLLPFKFHTEMLLPPQMKQASGKVARFCTALPNSAV